MRTFSRAVSIALTFSSLAALGCECSDVTLGRDDAGRRDAGAFTPRTDECGNGIDDDRNGRIDDGCVCGQGDVQSCFSGEYPGHGVGACRDGRQTCAVQEFGDWGAFMCVGETLPSAEICDDIDNDCDGARDEDCPCEAGATRACSDEFAIAPCMPGTQTCRGGTWSRCEGAIGPTADVCGDAIDNDCDGLTNEGCECVSSPEQCNDRIDNDCDGEVDEVTCAPFPDAGMSMPDAGVPIDAASPDAASPQDAASPRDASCTGTFCDVAPRPISPLSTSTVTSRRPTLRWENPSGEVEARVELCRDRACTETLAELDGTTSARPATELPSGWVFWRLRSRRGSLVGAAFSPTWQFWVGRRSADDDRDTSWGSALDVNGDGMGDIAVAAVQSGDASQGSVHIHLGPALAEHRVILGTAPAARLGTGVASADMNGDGFSDLAVLAMRYRGAGVVDGGDIDVYFGSPEGLAATPAVRMHAPGSGVGSMSGAGDVNGDGYGDLAVNFFGDGVVRIYFGGPLGLPSEPARVLTTAVVVAPSGGVVSADFDGDGDADLAVGFPGSCGPSSCDSRDHGRVLVYSNTGRELPTIPTTRLDGANAGDSFGHQLAAGDSDGDGRADLLVGEVGFDIPRRLGPPEDSGEDAGRVSLFTRGLLERTTPLTGAAFNERLGASVALTDLDADGYADVVAGAINAYLPGLFGPSGGQVLIAWSSVRPVTSFWGLETLGSTAGFGSAIGCSDVTGGGAVDLVVGAIAGRGPGSFGFVRLYRGPLFTSEFELVGPRSNSQFGARIAY